MHERWPELAEAASALDDAAFDQLLSLARLLASRQPADSHRRDDVPVTVTQAPAGESVVAAVRRLRRTYSMIDPRVLLADVGEIMTRHTVEAMETADAIAGLEEVFMRHYQRLQRADAKPPEPKID